MKDEEQALFEAAVDAVERRAQLLLEREGRLGGSIEGQVQARIPTAEIYGRLSRLQRKLLHAKARADRTLGSGEGQRTDRLLWNLVAEAADAAPRRGLRRMTADIVRDRLLHLLQVLEDIDVEAEAAARRQAARLGRRHETLHAHTTNELRIYLKDFGPTTRSRGARLMCIIWLGETMRRSLAECRRILAGRYAWDVGKTGRPAPLRGRWFASHLIGFAEGFGLRTSRNAEPQVQREARTAVDAYLLARARLSRPIDPVARRMLDEAPATFDAVMRRHLRPSDSTQSGDDAAARAPLVRTRQHGRDLGVRALRAFENRASRKQA
ncbi:MAG: hypothetical protein AAF676_04340 [Pseudomonadota bacterium]